MAMLEDEALTLSEKTLQIARTKIDAELMKAGLSTSIYGYDGNNFRGEDQASLIKSNGKRT